MNKIVLATRNEGKVRELTTLLAATPWEVLSLSAFDAPEVEEHGYTFVENAILKARSAAFVTGMWALADDSGIEVDALNGEPGVHSARYAGVQGADRDNIDKLLQALEGIALPQRRARFRCVMVCMRHAKDPAPIITEGVWEGFITQQPMGEHGFGYDPIFAATPDSPTAAQLDSAQKNALSHRGQALRAMIAQLKAISA